MYRMRARTQLATLAALGLALALPGCSGDDKKKETTTPKKLTKRTKKSTKGDGGRTSAPRVARRVDNTPARREAPAPVAPPTADVAPAVKKDAPPPRSIVATARSMVGRGRYLDAIRQAKAALRRSEKYTPAMEIMARAYYKLGKHEFASSICNIALNINPNSGRCYNIKAFVELKRGDKPKALQYFKKATEVEPGFGPPWVNLGAQYLYVKNYTAAAPALEKAVKLLPRRPEVHLNLGAAYRGQKKNVKALNAFKKALQLRPGYPAALFNIGILYLDAESFPGMTKIQQLQTAITYLNKYRQKAFSRNQNDPVDTYLKAANKAIKREERRIKREARRKARDAAKKAREAAKAKAAPKAKPKPSK